MNQTRYMLALMMGVLLSSAVRICTAATLTCAGGDVACLIAAINTANHTPEPDTIQLAAGTYTLTTADHQSVNGSWNGLPAITTALTIHGAGADRTTIDRHPEAALGFRFLYVEAAGNLTMAGLTLARAVAGPGGGAIENAGGRVVIVDSVLRDNYSPVNGVGGLWNTGTASILRSTLMNNRAGFSYGGGIYNEGTLEVAESAIIDGVTDGIGGLVNVYGSTLVTNSTVARNTGGDPGGSDSGGLQTCCGGTLTLLNSTVVFNTSEAVDGSGGISNFDGIVFLQNTILAHNVKHGHPYKPDAPNCFGTITSLGHNVVGSLTGCDMALHPTDRVGDPGLAEFTDDGTPGHAHYPPLPDSPVINAGDVTACPTTDQLGRPRAGPCDIGAVEFQPLSPPSLAIRLNQAIFQPGQTLRVTLDLSNPGLILTTDAYVGVILPDGMNTLFLTNVSPLEGVMTTLNSDPRTFAGLLRNVSWPAGMRATQQEYFTYTFTGLESSGTYHFLVGWTKPNSLEDGRIDEGDILALAWAPFTFTRGSTPALYATMRAIQAKHGK